MKLTKESLQKAITFWFRMETIGCIVLIVVLACLVISFVGIPKEISETAEALVYTESGDTLPCQIRLEGEITRYPLRNNADHEICAYRDHILVSEMMYNTKKQTYGYCQTYRFTGIKAIAQDVLLVEMDLQTLFPEQDSQRCVIAVPAQDAGQIEDILNQTDLSGDIRQRFDWFLEKQG